MRLDSQLRCLHDKTIHSLSLQPFQRILGIVFGSVASDSHPKWRYIAVDPRGISATFQSRYELISIGSVIVSCHLN
jgi:hypothetical protein